MQAIRTCFIGQGHHHGAMVRAQAVSGYTRIPYQSELDEFHNHANACKALLTKLGWTPDRGYDKQWHGGEHGGDYFWVYAQEATRMPR